MLTYSNSIGIRQTIFQSLGRGPKGGMDLLTKLMRKLQHRILLDVARAPVIKDAVIAHFRNSKHKHHIKSTAKVLENGLRSTTAQRSFIQSGSST